MKKIFVLSCFLVQTLNAQWVQTKGPVGRSVCFAVSGVNLFAGGSGGVFLYNNSDTSWSAVNNGLTEGFGNAIVYCLAVSPNGTGGTNLFAGTYGGSVFLSTNNGTNWTSGSTGLPNSSVDALAISGANLFAASHGHGVFLSTNNGINWTAMNSGLTSTFVNTLAVSATNLFAGIGGEGSGGVFLSTNNGTSWTAVKTGLPTNTYVFAFAVSGTNLFAGTDGGIFHSSDYGSSWAAASTGLTYTYVRSLAISATNLFAGPDGSVFFSDNSGTSWTEVNTGLPPGTSFYALVVSGASLFAGASSGVWRRPLSEMIAGDSVSKDLVQVTGGTFTAGLTPVTISSFKMNKYEVTFELWTEVRNWALTHGYNDLVAGQNGSNPAGTNNPVTNVNWYDAVKWCNARSEKDGLAIVYHTDGAQTMVYRTGELDLNIDAVERNASGYRLPTETEWEFAARGGNQTHGNPYSGSNTIDSVAWDSSNSGWDTHTVGTKSPNELGIYDMTGNVDEWCWDWYGSAYPSGTADPKGPTSSRVYRLLRGGSFTADELACRVGARGASNPLNRIFSIGFRSAQSVAARNGLRNSDREVPLVFSLTQNYPNPFNPTTTIRFELPVRSKVRLLIFNLLGQQVAELANEEVNAGYVQKVWNTNVASGLYFFRLEAVSVSDPNKGFVDVKKMILLK